MSIAADLQTDELTAVGCFKVFTEQVSGAVHRRPQAGAAARTATTSRACDSCKLA